MENQLPTQNPVSNPSLSSTPPPVVNNPHPSYPLLIGVILIGLVLFGAGGYYFGRKSSNISPSTNQTALTTQVPLPSISDSPQPTTVPVVTTGSAVIPQGWSYTLSQQQPNANECVKIALPPQQPPYVYTLNENQVPSVTDDKESGRFWYLGGASSPHLLTKVSGQTYKQNMALFATENEASGYISQAVTVSCTPNASIKDNAQLTSELNTALERHNSSTEEKGMEAQTYRVLQTTPTQRWGKDVIDFTVNEDGNEVKYTMFVTPSYIYEVRVLGASTDTFVKQTAQQIFENLNFN